MFHIIDDEVSVCEVVAEILEDYGYETMSFGCPEDYISFVSSPNFRDPIAVFTDVTMPTMSGYEMINVVSKLKSGLKFVVMTADPTIRSEHMDKACMYLAKPFTPNNLIKMVDRLIQCHAFSPADYHGCTSVDNRGMFSIENWSCPHTCKDCS